MMMKKTTSALAVAALLGTGAASAATFQVDENTSMSVGANLNYAYVINDGAEETTDIADNVSSFYFKGEHTASNGLTTSLNLEIDGLTATDTGATSQVTDEANIGLAGSFGKVEIGNDLGTYGAVDLTDLDQWFTISDIGNNSNNAARYTLPDMGNLSAAVGLTTSDDDADDASRSGTTLHGSLTYDLGAAAISAAYDDRGAQLDGSGEDGSIYGVAVQTDLGGVDARLSYEKDTTENNEATYTGLAGIYSIGKVTFTGVIQNVSAETNATLNTIAGDASVATGDSVTQTNLQVGYSVTDNMYVFLEQTDTDFDNGAGGGTAAGVYVGF